MKNHLILKALCLGGLLITAISTGCFYYIDDEPPPFVVDPEPMFTNYAPVYMSRQELESAITTEPARELKNLGKIWRQDNMLYIVERYEGIHVIDNSNPSSPQVQAFIRIPGNVDLALKGNTLFADSGPDLISVDITNVQQVKVMDRVINIYAEAGLVDPDGIFHYFGHSDEQVLVGFNKIN